MNLGVKPGLGRDLGRTQPVQQPRRSAGSPIVVRWLILTLSFALPVPISNRVFHCKVIPTFQRRQIHSLPFPMVAARCLPPSFSQGSHPSTRCDSWDLVQEHPPSPLLTSFCSELTLQPSETSQRKLFVTTHLGFGHSFIRSFPQPLTYMMVQRPQLQLEKQKLTSLIEKQNQKQWGKRNNLNLTEIPVGPSSPCPT